MTTGDKAFHDELNSGRVGVHQLRVLSWMRAATRNGAEPTSGEVLADNHIANVNLWRARFTELADKGAIIATGTRTCEVTGREALTWRLAPPPWVPRAKPPNARKQLGIAITLLQRILDSPPSAWLRKDIVEFLAQVDP